MSTLSFDIKTSGVFFIKLLEDYGEFKSDYTSSRKALNCAMTAWHLSDWVYHEYNYKEKEEFTHFPSFQKYLKELCPSLQIMHDLTNGTKHYHLARHKPSVEDTELHHGGFSSDFSNDFDVSGLEISMKDGSRLFFEDEMETVIEFWKKYLRDNHKIDVQSQ